MFPAHSTHVCIVNRSEVTEDTLGEILGVTAFEQHPLINREDVISVFYFHSGSLKNSGTVTIWHNKNQAAIKTSSATLSGEWVENLKVIVSEEQEVGWTMKGELVTGRIAMDINGSQGIYSCGQFFENFLDRMAVGF
ncbi:MAG TPA: hypothetical protein DCZ75_02740 [Geobacter sp.]|nr:hypothetical protein [Geobacter sp.]